MKLKIKVGILFGGKSAEHEVSLRSAKNVLDAIDKEKYELILIGIDKKGKWLPSSSSKNLLDNGDAVTDKNGDSQGVAITPQSKGKIMNPESGKSMGFVDVISPVLHGPFGEDGTVQGLLKLANIPFVGASVLGSAIGMDKDVAKRLLRDAGILVANFIVVKEKELPGFKKLVEIFGLPFFVKPANLGSSIGTNKVKSEKDFEKSVKEAFRYDRKILIEEYIGGREIECSVLGNDSPIASLPGEVILHHEFYSYEAKYLDENGATLEIPAKLPNDVVRKIQDTAVRAFKILACEGMGRVDFFLKEDGDIFINEINTIPGFTSISMYPKLWEVSGISYTELIDKLIQLAFERFEKEQKLETSYN